MPAEHIEASETNGEVPKIRLSHDRKDWLERRRLHKLGVEVPPPNQSGHSPGPHKSKAALRMEREEFELQRYPDVRFGTATTSTPDRTTLDGLLNAIETSLTDNKVSFDGDYPAQLTILVSPAYAKHALNDALPIKVLDRVYGLLGGPLELDTVIAVVDKVSTLEGAANNEGYAGNEGLTYCFDAKPVKPIEDGQRPLQSSAQKPGSITFELPSGGVRVNDQHIQMPLAQTIFSTGLVSTMVHKRYSRASQDEPLRAQTQQQLESQSIRLPLESDSGFSNVHAPLIPLTPLRNIKYVMGNIIRQISSTTSFQPKVEGESNSYWTSPEHGDPMPASSELEEQVSKYFEALDVSPEAVNVWALVVPQEIDIKELKSKRVSMFANLLTTRKEALAKIWDPKSDESRRALSHLANGMSPVTSQGVRLIRVLSGGGGWGKKAGLLSLDPDVEYSTRELRQDTGWQFNFDLGEDADADAANARQRKEALGEIVKPGDRIMFFIAPRAEHVPVTSTPSFRGTLRHASRIASFGVVPSTIDAEPSKQQSIAANTPSVQYANNIFAMLSEGGMALSTRGVDGRTQKTKFDVPFGRFGGFQTWNAKHVKSSLETGTMAALNGTEDVGPEGPVGNIRTKDYFEMASEERKSASPGQSGNSSFQGVTNHKVGCEKQEVRNVSGDELSARWKHEGGQGENGGV